MASSTAAVVDGFGQVQERAGRRSADDTPTGQALRAAVAVVLALHPIAFAALLFISWDLAASQLGQNPVPYQHDPQFLGDPIALLNTMWMVLLMTVIPAFILSLVIAVFRFGATRRWVLFAPLVAWVISTAVVAANWDALVWFID